MNSTEQINDLRASAKAIATEANECCNRSDGYEKEIEDLALQHLANAVSVERERCAKIAEDWLATFGERGPTSGAVSAQTWANDAIKDIAEAIRERASLPSTK